MNIIIIIYNLSYTHGLTFIL